MKASKRCLTWTENHVIPAKRVAQMKATLLVMTISMSVFLILLCWLYIYFNKEWSIPIGAIVDFTILSFLGSVGVLFLMTGSPPVDKYEGDPIPYNPTFRTVSHSRGFRFAGGGRGKERSGPLVAQLLDGNDNVISEWSLLKLLGFSIVSSDKWDAPPDVTTQDGSRVSWPVEQLVLADLGGGRGRVVVRHFGPPSGVVDLRAELEDFFTHPTSKRLIQEEHEELANASPEDDPV